MSKTKGFTLIEILIALTIFAILATLTSTILYQSFSTRTRVNEQADKLNAIELAISMIQQDARQAISRGVRGNEMHPFAPFIGRTNYLEFTRDGLTNPQSNEKRSTLVRIALVCEEDRLIHRRFLSLDSVNRNAYKDKILLDGLKDCHFNFLSNNLQLLSEWRENALTQGQKKEPMPKAFQINLTMKDWGEMNLLFTIPEALYASVSKQER